MGNTTGGSVSGNYLLNPNHDADLSTVSSATQPFGSQLLSTPLVVDASQNVTTNNNTIDQTSGRMWVTDTQYSELAAYAPGATYRLNAYNLSTLPNPSVTLTDADGNILPATIQKTASHALDVPIPATAALGGAYFTLTSGSTKYFGTLFLDSQDNIPALNGCTYETSMPSTSVAAGSSSLPILVVTQAGCSYQVLATDSFVSPGASATGTGVVSVGLAANTGAARTTTIEIAGQPFTLTQAAFSGPTITAVQDSASNTPNIAPGSILGLYGTNLTPSSPGLSNFPRPTVVGGVKVTFTPVTGGAGTDAYLIYVGKQTGYDQINALLPSTVPAGAYNVTVTNGTAGPPFVVQVVASKLGLFTQNYSGTGPAVVQNYISATGTYDVNRPTTGVLSGGVTSSPAKPGQTLVAWGTGLGAWAPSDNAAGVVHDFSLTEPIAAIVGGVSIPVAFAGRAGYAGEDQINFTLPANVPTGCAVTLQISVNGVLSAPTSIAIAPSPSANACI